MQYDIFGLGNALVDMEYRVDDGYLRSQDIPKGHMTLVDAERMNALIGTLHELTPERVSGGSAANSLIAAQAFGCSTFYACRVADDDTGRFFLDDMARIGVATNASRQPATRGIRALPCARDPRCGAKHEHVPRRVR